MARRSIGILTDHKTPASRRKYWLWLATLLIAAAGVAWFALIKPNTTQNTTVTMEFFSESANIRKGKPIQDVFVDAGGGQVVRPEALNSETLALPVYGIA